MEALRQNEHCTPFLKDFLDYIQKRMLVDKTKRETSDMVRTQLSRLLDKCQQDREYASVQASTQMGLNRRNSIQPKVSNWRRMMKLLCG